MILLHTLVEVVLDPHAPLPPIVVSGCAHDLLARADRASLTIQEPRTKSEVINRGYRLARVFTQRGCGGCVNS